jgi:hypothetical protein
MKTRKVSLNEFKEIVKNIIKEESIKEKKELKVSKDAVKIITINKLMGKGDKRNEASQKVDDNSDLLDEIFNEKKDNAGIQNIDISNHFLRKLEAKENLKKAKGGN